jgi:hypothetical protein
VRPRALDRLLTLLAAVLWASACARWQPATQPVPDLLAQKGVEELRVTRADSSRLVLYHPVLVGDSLVGTRSRRTPATPFADTEARRADGPEVTLPLSDVRQVETRQARTGRTLLLVLGIAAVASLAALIAIGISLQGGFLGS